MTELESFKLPNLEHLHVALFESEAAINILTSLLTTNAPNLKTFRFGWSSISSVHLQAAQKIWPAISSASNFTQLHVISNDSWFSLCNLDIYLTSANKDFSVMCGTQMTFPRWHKSYGKMDFGNFLELQLQSIWKTLEKFKKIGTNGCSDLYLNNCEKDCISMFSPE